MIAHVLRLCWRRFARGDRMAGFELSERLTRRLLYPGYRFVDPRIDWWQDPWFQAYLERFGETELLNADRRFAVSQLLKLITRVPGDTAECGVYRGAMSWLICHRTAGQDRIHHGFDSFAGLSQPKPEDGRHWRRGQLACSRDQVEASLAAFLDRLRLHPGWIPERFDEVADRRFAFVHIDVDLAQPTADSLAFFYPRLNPGGILVCDDYGCSTCPGATAAMDRFFAQRPEPIVALAGGGGFVIRESDAR